MLTGSYMDLTGGLMRSLKHFMFSGELFWCQTAGADAQIHMSKDYINTGSEYLVCAGFCALGLPASDAFWANPYADWTSKKAWNNVEVPADHSIRNWFSYEWASKSIKRACPSGQVPFIIIVGYKLLLNSSQDHTYRQDKHHLSEYC